MCSACTICLLLTTSAQIVVALKFSSVANNIGLQNATAKISTTAFQPFTFTFADFNSDKATDFLLLNYTGQVHSVYLWDREKNHFWNNPVKLEVSSPIAMVDTADFDGDGLVDLLSVSSASGAVKLTVHWMTLQHTNLSVESSIDLDLCSSFSALPLILDYNGDHLPDILCVGQDTLVLWISNGEKRNFSKVELTASNHYDSVQFRLFKPSAAYYVDINSDCLADLLLFESESGNTSAMEVWLRDPYTGQLVPHSQVELISLPNNAPVINGPTFTDMDGDGVFDVVYLVCSDASCHDPTVQVLYQTKVPGVDVVNCQTTGSWAFSISHSVTTTLHGAWVNHFNVIFSVSDVNLDGFPDLLLPAYYDPSDACTDCHSSATPPGDCATCRNISEYQPRPLILLGGPTGELYPQWNLFDDNVTRVAYFDLWEDGVMDVIGVEEGENKMVAYRQMATGDHTFLKVLVLSGNCFSSCTAKTEPYGSVLPGATVAFSTTDRNGNKERSVAVVRSGGSRQQLPFIVFGLGETPNFIEDLTIGAGYSKGGNDSGVALGYHQWSLLVPNSQIIVITTPPNMASKWRVELYLTPSQLVYSTAAVLCGIAIVTAGIAALLQAREKYQDSKEKKQAKHRFHFNAM